jgi:hypothetical protein
MLSWAWQQLYMSILTLIVPCMMNMKTTLNSNALVFIFTPTRFGLKEDHLQGVFIVEHLPWG